MEWGWVEWLDWVKFQDRRPLCGTVIHRIIVAYPNVASRHSDEMGIEAPVTFRCYDCIHGGRVATANCSKTNWWLICKTNQIWHTMASGLIDAIFIPRIICAKTEQQKAQLSQLHARSSGSIFKRMADQSVRIVSSFCDECMNRSNSIHITRNCLAINDW